jgi:peptidylprolyl isomerase
MVNAAESAPNATAVTVAAAAAAIVGLAAGVWPDPARAEDPPPTPARGVAEVLAASGPADWRPLDDENTVYLELDSGRVVIELAPWLAPQHVANIKALVREGYFDGLAIYRAQDNWVVQWGDADERRKPKSARAFLQPEFTVPVAAGFAFTRLADPDGYAPQVGFSNGFPMGFDPQAGLAWLTHCYGAVGVARGNELDSGSGMDLYAVIGHAPRHLDRNITVVGRVMWGMELLSSLPRGPAPMGFYVLSEQRVPVRSARVAADVPAKERTSLEVIRTDTKTFADLVESRRNRLDDWNRVPAGHIELCNVPLPVRPR